MQEIAQTTTGGSVADGNASRLPQILRMVKAALKQSPFSRIAQRQYEYLGRTGRRIIRIDARIVNRYLARQKTWKLHLGCGDHPIAGWLNSDLSPRTKNVVVVDVAKRFPFEDQTFDYVFNEHMIEHISYARGNHMLRECCRVLKNGGRIRISTPDLSFLIGLYGNSKSGLQDRYIKWAVETFTSGALSCGDTFVINNFVRDWGHSFIYDEKTLRLSLETAGFVDIVRCGLNESDDENLRHLENEARLPEGFLRLETFTLEAARPARP